MKVTTEIKQRQITNANYLVLEADGTLHNCVSPEHVVKTFSYLMSHSTGVQNGMEQETGDVSTLATIQSMQVKESVQLEITMTLDKYVCDICGEFTVIRLV